MSTRRLADEAVQPPKFAFSRQNAAWAKAKIRQYPPGRQRSAVIPVLWKAQEQQGWVSRAAIETVAGLLDMPYIRVLEVATFYTQFQLEPVGTRAHVQVCGTTPCMLRGAEDLRAVCERKIHPEAHHTNADGTLSWEEVECLGACVNAPMVAIGMDTYEDLTPDRLEQIIDAFQAGKGDTIPPGTQIDRVYSAQQTGRTTLLDAPANANARRKPAAKATPAKGASAPTRTAAAPAGKSPAKKAAAPKARARSATLFEAPRGKPDDLKLISGVGPVLEKKLNALGVTRYAQVAAFKKADIVKLDDALSFKGRIERDGWVKQARALAKGGVAEYRRVFGKDPR